MLEVLADGVGKRPKGSHMLKLSWTDIETLSASIADQVAQRHGPIDPDTVLVGVARGGLIPAALVAHRLGLRKMTSPGLMSYADGVEGAQGRMQAYGAAPEAAAIVIDDIIDSGRTLEEVRARYPDAIVAALIDKTGGVSGVIAGKQTPAGEWVEFPWEAIGAL